MTTAAHGQHPSGLRLRTYGVRSRVRRFRWEVGAGRELVRWFPRDWFADPLAMVDLCSAWEHAWVRRHVEEGFEGRGAIVELGPWMGRITTGILRGLDRNPTARTTTVHSYDLFADDAIEARLDGLPIQARFRDGESFLPTFLDRIDHDPRVVPHVGDILDQRWDGAPIEFLFNDLSKTWDHWNHVRSTFHRHLMVGGTLVEQDWAHAGTPWIHVWHHRHRAHFEALPQVPNAGSVPFRLLAPLPESALVAEGLDDYGDDEIAEAFDWATSLVDPLRRANVRGAFVHLYTLHGDLQQASRLCVEELAAGPIDGELLDMALPELARRLTEQDSTADQ